MSGRIKKEIKQIDYGKIKQFFENRAGKFHENNPYSVTMYQDNNPDLVNKRNLKETGKLIPLLQLDSSSKILDIACGIGRWSDAIQSEIKEYCGIDFNEELIEIAKMRNLALHNRSFFVASTSEIQKVLSINNKGNFNRILLIGILMYLNDDDVRNTLLQIEKVCKDHSIICIREPIGIDERLTLDNIFSDELGDNYSAIYRTRNELLLLFETCLFKKGFKLTYESYLFDEDELNNRKDTAQYYFIFER